MIRQWLKNYLTRHLLNSVITNDVIFQDSKKNLIFIDDKPITENELKQLKAEVKALEGFRIWNIMTNSIRHVAYDKIFNKAVNFDDVTYGKAMLYNLDTLQSIARVIKSRP